MIRLFINGYLPINMIHNDEKWFITTSVQCDDCVEEHEIVLKVKKIISKERDDSSSLDEFIEYEGTVICHCGNIMIAKGEGYSPYRGWVTKWKISKTIGCTDAQLGEEVHNWV